MKRMVCVIATAELRSGRSNEIGGSRPRAGEPGSARDLKTIDRNQHDRVGRQRHAKLPKPWPSVCSMRGFPRRT